MSDEQDDKICAECKHLLGRRAYDDTATGWKCYSPKNVASVGRDMVTGKAVYNLRSETCYDTRKNPDLCGPQGAWFEAYVRPAGYGPAFDEPTGDVGRPRLVAGQRVTADKLLEELDSFTMGEKGK